MLRSQTLCELPFAAQSDEGFLNRTRVSAQLLTKWQESFVAHQAYAWVLGSTFGKKKAHLIGTGFLLFV